MIRVLVVDDHPVVRHGIISVLHYERDIEVVGEADNGQEAVRLITDKQPDIVLLDLRLPHLSGIEVMKQVRPALPQVRFLVLTTYDTDEYIGPALAAGAQGYLLKDAVPDDLVNAIHALTHGGTALDPVIAARLLSSMSSQRYEPELSPRETEVLRYLVAGASNKAIAAQLAVSENTIKTHLSHIFAKLGVQSRGEAIAAALQRGLVPLDRPHSL